MIPISKLLQKARRAFISVALGETQGQLQSPIQPRRGCIESGSKIKKEVKLHGYWKK